MIVLDTNVLSELLKPEPDQRVIAWLDKPARRNVYSTAICRGEMLYGAHLLPRGGRRRKLEREVLGIFDEDLAGRVLPYDSAAADAHAELAAARRAAGKPMGQADAMIAGIVRANGAMLATRNVRDFEDCGIGLIDPWH